MSLSRAPLLLVVALGGCVTAPSPAPVSERASAPVPAREAAPAPARPKVMPGAPVPATYTVAKGDTLYGIAKAFGLNFREVAVWNNLPDPYLIRQDQVLKLRAPAASDAPPPANVSPVAASAEKAVVETAPLRSPPPPETRPLVEPPLKSEPLALKQPYSEAARAALEPAAPTTAGPSAATPPDDRVEWAWPTQGKVVATFLDTGLSKGIDIAGVAGQAVYAAAPGHVEYSGAGLRAYGKLIIIRHNTTFMSVYAHNKELLVKQGDQVGRGQKIALMGEHDSGEPRLHFEIRQLGRPADPMAFLPARAESPP